MSTAAKQTRENRTITVDFRDEATYVQLLGDGKAFVECVCAFLLSLGFQLAHKAPGRGGEVGACPSIRTTSVSGSVGSPSGGSSAPGVARCSPSSPISSCALVRC